MNCYFPPNPPGVNNLDDNERQRHIIKAYNGDSVTLNTHVMIAGEPATPENSHLKFVLVDDRFYGPQDAIWTADWDTIQTHDNASGLITITIPSDVTATLRRGSFLYSLRVSGRLEEIISTVLEGTLLIEYAPTSPLQDIPYRD